LLRDDIAFGIGAYFVDGPLCGVLGWAGGWVIGPSEAAEVEVVAVHGVEELVVAGVAGAGYAENFVVVVFAVEAAVGEVEGEAPLSHLGGGRDSAWDRASQEFYDRGHEGSFKF
jgi:hypothetical protein